KEYLFTDEDAASASQRLYYRVRLENTDGHLLYSNIISISKSVTAERSLKVNLVGNNLVLTAPSGMAGRYTCSLLTIRGKLLFRSTFVVNEYAGQQTVPLPVALLQRDVYIVNIAGNAWRGSTKILLR
ncbi:MAG: hypothetical protein JST39_14145, partial [Bacteroidetes bacterium]|nr:hypothetical protein [Bacteroidota bacterium]